MFGVAPDRAKAVVITVHGRKRFAVKPQEGPKTLRGNFYVIRSLRVWERRGSTGSIETVRREAAGSRSCLR